MQQISAFNDNLGTAIGLLGPAGSGKTVLGMRLFPRTYVLVLDLNFSSGKRYLESINKLDNIVGFDTVTIDETGKPIPPNLWYNRFFALINAASKDPSVDAIFVDGATQISECIIAKIMQSTTPETIQIVGGKESFQKWGTVQVTWKGLVTQLRATGKKFVLAIHESKNQDESDQIWKTELLIPGSTKDTLPNLMSDMWRTEVHKEGPNHVWKVRTLPEPYKIEMLKNTFGLPALMTADELVKKIQEKTK